MSSNFLSVHELAESCRDRTYGGKPIGLEQGHRLPLLNLLVGCQDGHLRVLGVPVPGLKRSAVLKNCVLERIDFSKSTFQNVQFEGVTIKDCRFEAVKFKSCIFDAVRIENSSFKNASFKDTALPLIQRDTPCEFTDVDFSNAYLSRSS